MAGIDLGHKRRRARTLSTKTSATVTGKVHRSRHPEVIAVATQAEKSTREMKEMVQRTAASLLCCN
ncbi:hypothetical protein M787_003765 [Chlamydia gallinacea 08-1274/3]|uniref:Uncharacterized protein n=1 Tax=Chlamydia gallinacea 08-1274/3 TaxID=1143323 RepID=A0A173DZT4_9CHLA|nr:hypothetical protein M787_003765 [Chlamydia gallinacea 08-1274/3]